jgi:hypothetical protein
MTVRLRISPGWCCPTWLFQPPTAVRFRSPICPAAPSFTLNPRTGEPGKPLPTPDWDQITGARGCTPQSCSFRNHYAELKLNLNSDGLIWALFGA